MNHTTQNDLRLIEAGFPCHQAGAKIQRERGGAFAEFLVNDLYAT